MPAFFVNEHRTAYFAVPANKYRITKRTRIHS